MEAEKRLMDIKTLQAYLSVGRAAAMRVGKEAEAEVSISGKRLYDRQKIDQYIDRKAKGVQDT